jgi:hypothetical protein
MKGREMNSTKTLAVLALIASLFIGAWALKEKSDADAARKSGWEYTHLMPTFFAEAEKLEASAAQKGWIFVGALAVAAILWGLGEVVDRLSPLKKEEPQQPEEDWRAKSLEEARRGKKS